MAKLERAKFGSKMGVILATAGSAVGLGNVWRFPFMAGQNGGCEFILIYVVCVLVLGIPCMINEFIIGRHAQANTARAYRKLANGTPWMLVGYLGVLTGFLITGYYSICVGMVPAICLCLRHGQPHWRTGRDKPLFHRVLTTPNKANTYGNIVSRHHPLCDSEGSARRH